MDALDRKIIRELQGNFPLEANPYEIMADRLGISTDLLWDRVLILKESGVIRRMGFSIDSRKIGYCSTLAAIRVSRGQIEQASELIAGYSQITHSYLRDDDFNIWFTIITESEERIVTILDEIRCEMGLPEDDMMDLPVKKLFKLDARFK
ncbi:MAG: Lrp/AsnC family transcriptional regulator [Planctomycetota bacterium]|nr:MAG: Lrp/AsnC family transcriptional regulator [Planctomycetota bacterium]